MNKLFRIKEVVSSFIAIASFFVFFDVSKYSKFIAIDKILFRSAVFNIVILILGIIGFSTFHEDYYLIKKNNGKYTDEGEQSIDKIQAILGITRENTIYFVERTTSIVGQLVKNFSLYMWPLILFYALSIIKDGMGLSSVGTPVNLSGCANVSEFLSKTNSPLGIWYFIISAFANIFNFISAIGLCVCFSILYQKTLDANNRSTLHMGLYYFLGSAYILGYIVLIGIGSTGLSLSESIAILDLFCSLLNGIAMILFFNRLVQVLYFYQKPLRRGLIDRFYYFIAVVIFPLYACSQLFFAVFDQLPHDPNHPYYIYIKGIVFYICFIGKFFLIMFLYSFIKTRWLHAAILPLLVYEHIPSTLGENIDGISDSIDSFGQDS